MLVIHSLKYPDCQLPCDNLPEANWSKQKDVLTSKHFKAVLSVDKSIANLSNVQFLIHYIYIYIHTYIYIYMYIDNTYRFIPLVKIRYFIHIDFLNDTTNAI